MEVNRSGYYRYYKNQLVSKKYKDIRLLTEARALHSQSNKSYGTRRMSKALQAKGYNIGRYKARTLMQVAGLECKQRRKYKITTNVNPALAAAENKLARNFLVDRPNSVWVADITFLSTQEGWLYLAVVLDLFSRKVVGWALAEHMEETLVHEALSMAVKERRPSGELMHHSDRGCQYTSYNYQEFLKDNNITVSMSRKGNCWDNAVMERFFGSLKSEWTKGKKYVTHDEAKADVIDYIERFYNNDRLHSTLNYLSPNQFEKNKAIKTGQLRELKSCELFWGRKNVKEERSTRASSP